MTVIARQVECPREWTKQRLQGMFPDATILGTNYGYWFFVPETNCLFIDHSWKELVRQVAKHLKGNNVAVPADLNTAMMEEFCSLTGSPLCAEDDKSAPERQRLFMQAGRFLRTITDFVAKGAHFVSQEEAERRSSICAQCPFNHPDMASCTGCAAKTAIAQLARFAIGRSTPLDGSLRTCASCGCKLAIKVHLPIETMNHHDLKDRWHSSCWMRGN